MLFSLVIAFVVVFVLVYFNFLKDGCRVGEAALLSFIATIITFFVVSVLITGLHYSVEFSKTKCAESKSLIWCFPGDSK